MNSETLLTQLPSVERFFDYWRSGRAETPFDLELNAETAEIPDKNNCAAHGEEDSQTQSDAAAMARLSAGDDNALSELMDRYAARLFHYLFRALQNEEDAADLAQESFVRVYQHRDRYDPKQKFSTWLYAIASNLVRNRFRWRIRHPQTGLEAFAESVGGDHSGLLADQRRLPDDELEKGELAGIVRKAVAELPKDLRLAIILSEYEERSNAEIGRILNCTTKAVEMRLYRARQQLRGKLKNTTEDVSGSERQIVPT